MISVIQRVKRATVEINKEQISSIGIGVVILLGFKKGDTFKQAEWLAKKIVYLRIFNDKQGKMNNDLLTVGGDALIVSQFTLIGNSRKGRRPSYFYAAKPEEAIPLYSHFIEQVKSYGIHTQEGVFGAMMDVSLVNDGPVTLIVEAP